MSIDIDSIQVTHTQTTKTKGNDQSTAISPLQTTAQPAEQIEKNVKLTANAVDLQTIQQQLSNIPEIDMQKVATIKTAIESGNYLVDANEIARKILNAQLNTEKS